MLHQLVEDQSSGVAALLWCSLNCHVVWRQTLYREEEVTSLLDFLQPCSSFVVLFFDGAITSIMLGFFLLNFFFQFFKYFEPFCNDTIFKTVLTPILLQLFSLSPIWSFLFFFFCIFSFMLLTSWLTRKGFPLMKKVHLKSPNM